MPTFLLCVLTLVLSCFVNTNWANAESAFPQSAQIGNQGQTTMIYGSQLMTPEERTIYQAKMRAATTLEEREKIRKEHHEEMQRRAVLQGLTLPEEPPEQGMMGNGMGYGSGMGNGMGYGRNR